MPPTLSSPHLAALYQDAAALYGDNPLCATRLTVSELQEQFSLSREQAREHERCWRPTSFNDIHHQGLGIAARLVELGLDAGGTIGLFADHCERWFCCHAGIMSAAGVIVPRGSDITTDDCQHIGTIAKLGVAIVSDKKVLKRLLAAELEELKTIICWDDVVSEDPHQP